MNIWNCMNVKQGDAKPGRARSAKSSQRKNSEENETPDCLVWSLSTPGRRKLLAFLQAHERTAQFYIILHTRVCVCVCVWGCSGRLCR